MDEFVDPTEDQNEEEEAVNKFLQDHKALFEGDLSADETNRNEGYNDIRFIALPEEQWLQSDRVEREEAGRPCPTLARLNPFIKKVSNGIRMNKPGINVKPAESDDVSKADIIEGLVRHVETQSDAKSQYARWAEDMVVCGIGHLRLMIEPSRANPEYMCLVQEHISDPLSVVWDRSAVKPDRADARRCFVIDYLPKSIVDDNYEDALGDWPSEESGESWTDWHDADNDEVRVCEMYKAVQVDSIEYDLYGERGTATSEGDVPEGARLISQTKKTEIRMWILTAGKILEGGLDGLPFPGSTIPIFPAIASEVRIGRQLVRKGLVRDAKDSVRLLNWAMALLVEAMAASPKPKWIGPVSAFKGLEDEWDNAGAANKPWVAYNDAAKAPPQYVSPPAFNTSLVQAMQVFDENIKQVTGIYDASLGAKSNETSGVAIRQRESQGDNATFDYVDNFHISLGTLGRAMVEIIPHVYNQERTIRIVGKDDEEAVLTLNKSDDATGMLYNPVEAGVYDVTVDAGPSFATQRQEASVAMQELIRAFPQAAPMIMDSLIKLQDWPGAEKLSKRLEMMLPDAIKKQEGIEMPQAEPAPPDPEVMAKAQESQAKTQKIAQETEGVALDNIAKKHALADGHAQPFEGVSFS